MWSHLPSTGIASVYRHTCVFTLVLGIFGSQILMLAWQGLHQLSPLFSTQALNPTGEEGMVCVSQRIDGRNPFRVAITVGGGDMKSPVNWMSVTHRAMIKEVDKSLRQVFRHTLDVCVWCVFVLSVLFSQLP